MIRLLGKFCIVCGRQGTDQHHSWMNQIDSRCASTQPGHGWSSLFLWLSSCPLVAMGMKTCETSKMHSFWEKKPTIMLTRLSEQDGALGVLTLSYIFCLFLQLLSLVHCPVFVKDCWKEHVAYAVIDSLNQKAGWPPESPFSSMTTTNVALF